ncbi:unnamed protein product [Amoebophrya sp. A120]|nr:unnamed protein product [Amoebophrya sp. A120]|eukprot:GSA120T00001196001.1
MAKKKSKTRKKAAKKKTAGDAAHQQAGVSSAGAIVSKKSDQQGLLLREQEKISPVTATPATGTRTDTRAFSSQLCADQAKDFLWGICDQFFNVATFCGESATKNQEQAQQGDKANAPEFLNRIAPSPSEGANGPAAVKNVIDDDLFDRAHYMLFANTSSTTTGTTGTSITDELNVKDADPPGGVARTAAAATHATSTLKMTKTTERTLSPPAAPTLSPNLPIGHSWWKPVDAPATNPCEELADKVFSYWKQHLKLDDTVFQHDAPTASTTASTTQLPEDVLGVEWWIQVADSRKRQGKDFHWDRDEAQEFFENNRGARGKMNSDDKQQTDCPFLATVTYLSEPNRKTNSFAPTIVLNAVPFDHFLSGAATSCTSPSNSSTQNKNADDGNGNGIDGSIDVVNQEKINQDESTTKRTLSTTQQGVSKGLISYPRKGKHIAFSGNFLHGIPAEFAVKEPAHATGGGRALKKTKIGNKKFGSGARKTDLKNVGRSGAPKNPSLDRDPPRVTFLANLWLGRRPRDVPTFGEWKQERDADLWLGRRPSGVPTFDEWKEEERDADRINIFDADARHGHAINPLDCNTKELDDGQRQERPRPAQPRAKANPPAPPTNFFRNIVDSRSCSSSCAPGGAGKNSCTIAEPEAPALITAPIKERTSGSSCDAADRNSSIFNVKLTEADVRDAAGFPFVHSKRLKKMKKRETRNMKKKRKLTNDNHDRDETDEQQDTSVDPALHHDENYCLWLPFPKKKILTAQDSLHVDFELFDTPMMTKTNTTCEKIEEIDKNATTTTTDEITCNITTSDADDDEDCPPIHHCFIERQ